MYFLAHVSVKIIESSSTCAVANEKQVATLWLDSQHRRVRRSRRRGGYLTIGMMLMVVNLIVAARDLIQLEAVSDVGAPRCWLVS